MWAILLVVDVLWDFLIKEFLDLNLVKRLREVFLLMDSEDGFFEREFGNLESDLFEFWPLLFSNLVKVETIVFDGIVWGGLL